MPRRFRYGRRADVREKPFPRTHSGTIKMFYVMSMVLNIGGILIPSDLKTYQKIRKNFKVGDMVTVTMFPWGQIKTIEHMKGSDHDTGKE